MKGAVGFFGVFLSFLSDAVGTSTDSYACGDTSLKCPHICAICKEYFGASTMDCLSFILDNFCLPKFNNTMMLQNSTDWCTWGNVNSLYSNLSFCTEEVSDCLLIPWPNRLVEEIFVDIHSKFFLECPTEEFTDPPPAIIFALVITPICLIPLMVSLVVLKTKNGDGTS